MISVAIPAYKAKFLNVAISSVLSQTYKDFELIIVNDASPDDIKSIVDKFDDKRIRYYENEINYGKESVVKNWNKCLSFAKGEYFVLFSDDDIYEENFLEEMIRLAEKYPETNIYHCRVRIIDDCGNTISFSPSCPEWESGIEFIWHRLKGFRYHYAPDFMVKTDALKRNDGFVDFPLAWGADDATWFKLSIDRGIGFSKRILCNWRKSNDNISYYGDVKARLKAIIDFNKWLNEFFEKYSSYFKTQSDMFSEIKSVLPNRIYSNKKQLLFNSYKNKKFNILNVSLFWIKYRKYYDIEFRMYISVIIKIIKQIFFKDSYDK